MACRNFCFSAKFLHFSLSSLSPKSDMWSHKKELNVVHLEEAGLKWKGEQVTEACLIPRTISNHCDLQEWLCWLCT